MRLNIPRLEPVDRKQLSDEQEKAIGKLANGEQIPNIFATLAHHPKLTKRWMVFGNHVLFKSSLSPRDRELIILRVGYLCKSGYEWAQHVVLAGFCDIDKGEIEQVKVGAKSESWSEKERLLMLAVDELLVDTFISQPTWDMLSVHYSTEQLMDLVFTVGQYNLVSMALNSFGVQLDEGLVLDKDLCSDASK